MSESIAIIGMGCRFPGGATTPDSFWRLLVRRSDAIVEVPPDRWNSRTFYHPNPAARPGTVGTRLGGFIEDIDRFDAGFFGISPREAALMDPQQRILLEVAFEALEDGGQRLEQLAGAPVGVFVGISAYDYAEIQHGMGNRDRITGHTNTGTALSIAANRISYVFNFTSPSVAIDTACSSSLVAMHLACRSLACGESRLALVGGVNAILKPEPTIGFSRASMLAPDGRCKTFDARANGYTRGEGAGVVLLKPLAAALADGDRIYAVVRGTGVNQDGHTNGMTVPSRSAQEALLREVYGNAGIDPAEVQYFEVHGTGTPVGDPIEAGAVGSVLSAGRRPDQPLVIGSVKTNIGHLEAGAGIASVIKAALAIAHRTIPPNLHFETPNPEIPFEALRLRVPVEVEPWPDNGYPARAGVNGFGFGGTNAHVVLEEAPAPQPVRQAALSAMPEAARAAAAERAYLLPISARSGEALTALARAYRDMLTDGAPEAPALHDVCYTAATRRSHHDHRIAVVGASRDDLARALDDFATAGAGIATSKGAARPPARGPVFVFSGMGPQWWGMGQQLLAQEPVFRAMIERCDALLRRHATWSLIDEMTRDEASSRMTETEISQPANFALQIALAALWRSWGIEPSAIVGHSTGEAAAFHIAGVLDLEEACRVIFHRSRLQQRTTGTGRIAAVGLSAADAEVRLRGHANRVAIAAVNSPSSVSLAGDSDALEAIVRDLAAENIFTRLLPVKLPFHSHLMDPLRDELLDCLQDLRTERPAVPLYSTVEAGRADDLALDNHYWWRNVRAPVRFADTIANLIEDGHDVFLEIGPHPVLSSMISECLAHARKKAAVISSLRRHAAERATLLGSLSSLHALGYPVACAGLYPEGGRFVQLPRYAWQHERYWDEAAPSRDDRIGAPVHPLLGRRAIASAIPTWEGAIDKAVLPYLDDHRVQGAAIYPGAGYVEMALAAGRATFGGAACVVEDLQLHKALVLGDDKIALAQITLDPQSAAFSVHSRTAGADGGFVLHASGRVTQKPGAAERVDVAAVRRRCDRELAAPYPAFASRGLDYGPCFQGIEQLFQGDGEALGRVRLAADLAAHSGDYMLHPALLDAAFQVMMGTLLSGGAHASRATYLPVQIERVRVHRRPDHDQPLWVHARRTVFNARRLEGRIRLITDSGEVIAEVVGFSCASLDAGMADTGDAASRWLHGYAWQDRPLAGAPSAITRARLADGMLGPLAIAAQVQPALDRLDTELDRARYYAEVEPRLDRLCIAYIVEALGALGLALRPGLPLVAGALGGPLGVAPHHDRLFARLLDVLGEAGVLRRTGDGWEVTRLPEAPPAAAQLAALEAEHRAYAPELTLTGRCGAQLAAVLRGAVDPLGLVFPDGSLADSELLYRDSRSFGTYGVIAEQAVRAIVAALPPDRTLRILEIGAGTGALASRLLPALPAGRTEYVYTDVSSTFTTKAEQRFGSRSVFRYAVLDIERELGAQGFEPGSFDLVLAYDVLHATHDLKRTLAAARQLVAPRGQLLLIELTKPPYWFDLVFGLLKGWWLFDDRELRKTSPCVSQAAWRGLLDGAGFGEVCFLADRSGGERPVHTVALAQVPANAAPPAVAEPEDLRGTWLVLVHPGDTGDELARQIAARGGHGVQVAPGARYARLDGAHFQVRPDEPEDLRAVVREVAAGGPLRGAIHLWGIDAPGLDDATRASIAEAESLGCVAALHLVHALVAPAASTPGAPGGTSPGATPPRLVLVTRGSHEVLDADPGTVAVLQAQLWGLGRVILNEHPELRCTLVDLGAAPTRDELAQLAEECARDDREREIALRGSRRLVLRVHRVTTDTLRQATLRPRPLDPDQPFKLDVVKTGSLDHLILRRTRRRRPGPGEVEIEVHATGLNFRDVMKVMGIYPTEGDTPLVLGDECAGRVVAVGDGVTELRTGDRVAAVAAGFGAYQTVATPFVAVLPDQVSFESGATIPITFLTAHYALNYLARMRGGERVLIHAGAGGVGLAAIQLAQAAGAEVLATAGSAEKRAYLRSLGVAHVMDSRSLDFADEILELTRGEGVDVVLNSLSGEAIPRSVALLRSYGRFLEIGKTDIYQNSKLGLLPFRNNLAFFAIDLDRVFHDRPQLAGEMLREVMRQFQAGAPTSTTSTQPASPARALRPLPVTSFPIGQAEAAFRFMAQAKHIGKVVLTMQDRQAKVAAPSFRGFPFRPDATYVVSGGLGGFGVAVARWMVEHGARHLVLIGRSGAATEAAQAAVRAMQGAGAEVRVVAADIADTARVAALLDEARRTMPPLAGVLHAAMVLDDCHLAQMNRGSLHKVLAPKVLGAWNLHHLTLNDPLELFVVFSSFAAMIGNPGQGNYVAANSFLDALAHHRRAEDRPALAIDWGAIDEVGYVAQHAEIARHFERHGLTAFKPWQAMSILEHLLRNNAVHAGAIHVDWQKWGKLMPELAASPRTAHLAAQPDTAGGGRPADASSMLERLRATPDEDRVKLLADYLRQQLATVLGISPSKLGIEQPLAALGLDSLMAVELSCLIEDNFGVKPPTIELVQTPSLSGLAEKLLIQIEN